MVVTDKVNVLIESMIVGNRNMIIVSVSLTRVNGLSQIVYLQQDPGRALFDDHHDYGDERQQEGEDHQTDPEHRQDRCARDEDFIDDELTNGPIRHRIQDARDGNCFGSVYK
jgi:hypothetical protein